MLRPGLVSDTQHKRWGCDVTYDVDAGGEETGFGHTQKGSSGHQAIIVLDDAVEGHDCAERDDKNSEPDRGAGELLKNDLRWDFWDVGRVLDCFLGLRLSWDMLTEKDVTNEEDGDCCVVLDAIKMDILHESFNLRVSDICSINLFPDVSKGCPRCSPTVRLTNDMRYMRQSSGMTRTSTLRTQALRSFSEKPSMNSASSGKRQAHCEGVEASTSLTSAVLLILSTLSRA